MSYCQYYIELTLNNGSSTNFPEMIKNIFKNYGLEPTLSKKSEVFLTFLCRMVVTSCMCICVNQENIHMKLMIHFLQHLMGGIKMVYLSRATFEISAEKVSFIPHQRFSGFVKDLVFSLILCIISLK